MISVVVFFCVGAAFGQTEYHPEKVSSGTMQVVDELAATSSFWAYARSYPEDYLKPGDAFFRLRDTATAQELIALCEHPQPTIRCFAFKALLYHKRVDLMPIIKNHLDDNGEVELSVCVATRFNVGDFFIEAATWDDPKKRLHRLTAAQSAELDRLLIHTPNKLRARATALWRVGPDEAFYPRIRELVVKDHDREALFALARFRKAEDVPLILGFRRDGSYWSTYRAIRYFPHSDFMPLLKRRLEVTFDEGLCTTQTRELYAAIASYESEKAAELLDSVYKHAKSRRGQHIDYVFNALESAEAPVFLEMRWELWEQHLRITPELYAGLSKADPQRAYAMTIKSLENASTVSSRGFSINSRDCTAARTLMEDWLSELVEREPDRAKRLVAAQLKRANVHVLPMFLNAVHRLKDRSFVEPMLRRLETEPNPINRDGLAKALKSYRDPEVDGLLVKAIQVYQDRRNADGPTHP